MNNNELKTELSERAANYLDYLEESLKSGGEFLSEQAPEVVRELILLHRVESLVYMIIALVMGVSALTIFWKVVVPEYSKGFLKQNDAIVIVGTLFTIAIVIVSIIIFSINLSIALKVWLAPRVFILEEVAKLLK